MVTSSLQILVDDSITGIMFGLALLGPVVIECASIASKALHWLLLLSWFGVLLSAGTVLD